MARNLYTIILDFRGGTYISQVEAADEVDAARQWAVSLAAEKPIGPPSAALSKTVIEELDADGELVALENLQGVWCITMFCGRHLATANIVRSR